MKKLILIAWFLASIGSVKAMMHNSLPLSELVNRGQWQELAQQIAYGRVVLTDCLQYDKSTWARRVGPYTFLQALISESYTNTSQNCSNRVELFLAALIKADKIDHSEQLLITTEGWEMHVDLGNDFLEIYRRIVNSVVNPVQNLNADILYQKDGVVITQQDVDAFGNGTLSKQRFDALYPTISAIVPALQGYGYGTYIRAKDWAPDRLKSGAQTLVAALKAQGQPQTQATSSAQQPSSLATQPATAQPASSSISTSSTPSMIATSVQTTTSSSAVKPANASISKPAVKKPVITSAAAKPQQPAQAPQVPRMRQSTFWVVDKRYMMGIVCVVVVLFAAYVYGERQEKDDEQEV